MSQIKNRAWVKNAAIVFLAVMLVLTFFSNTILNWSLPQVSGQYAGWGQIYDSIRGSGNVVSNMEYSVQIDKTRKIQSVLVRRGDVVEAGQVLFLLDEANSEELQAALDTLESLEYAYDVKILTMTVPDYEESNQAIADKKQAIAEAEAKLPALQTAQQAYSEAVKAREAVQSDIEAANERIEALNEAIAEVAESSATSSSTLAIRLKELELAKTNLKNAQKLWEAANRAVSEWEAQMPADLAQAKAAWESLNRTYQEMLTDYTNAETDYEALVKAKNDCAKKRLDVSTAAEKLTKAGEAVAEKEQVLAKAERAYETLLAGTVSEAAIADAKKTAQDKSLEAETLWTLYNTYVTNGNEAKAAQTKSEAERASAEAQTLVKRAGELETERSTFLAKPACVAARQAITEAEAALDTEKQAYALAEKGYADVVRELEALPAVSEEQVTQAGRQLAKDKTNLAYQKAEMEAAQKTYETVSAGQTELTKRKTVQKQAQDAVDSYTEAVERAQEALDAAVAAQTKNLQTERKAEQTKLKTLQKQLTEADRLVQSYESQLTTTPETLAAEIKQMNRELASLVSSLAKQQATDDKQSTLTDMELQKDREAIEKQRAEVEKLRGNGEGQEVTARYGGLITEITCIAGDTASPGMTLASIEVEGKGYTLTIPVSVAQSQQVHIGDVAKVSDFWWGNVSVILQAIKTDPANPGKSRLLEFSVTGDVYDGQSLTISLGDRKTDYNTIVPNSALHEDKDGSFVLVSTAKSTPLGNRYYVTRVAVKVLASDTANTAIDMGEDHYYEYVITSSTAPIKDGDMIRMAGNS